VSSPDSRVGIVLEFNAWSQSVDVNSASSVDTNSISPEGARGIHQSLRAETFVSGILTRRLRNSHAEATILLWRARMAGLGEVPERRMPKAPLIAVVEDDWFFRDSMRSLMKSLGHTVEAFPSAADFLASSRLTETACLIADVHMPTMTGLELYRHLIDAGYAIPTILITAYPNDADRTQALSDGVVCYLPKPVDEDRLIRCLRAALSVEPPDEDQ
jgi:CheY-like chemotaxis protein